MHAICDRIARQIGGQFDLAQRLLLADLQLPQRTKARTEVETTPCETGVELGDVKGLRALRPHIGEQYAGRHGTSTASQPGGDVAHPCARVIGTGIVLVRRTAERHCHDTVAADPHTSWTLRDAPSSSSSMASCTVTSSTQTCSVPSKRAGRT